MSHTILDGSGEQVPGHRALEGTDLEIAYSLLGDDLVLRVNKAGVQVFGVVLENAAKTLTAQQLLGANRSTNYNMLSLAWEFLKRGRAQWFQRFG